MVRTYEPVGGKYGTPAPAPKKPINNNNNTNNSKTNSNSKTNNNTKASNGSKSDPNKVKTKGNKASKSLNASKDVRSRREITVVTMNMNGKAVMGFTPKYKTNMVQEYLATNPEIVFIQDSVEYNDLSDLLIKASDGKYDFHFQEADDPNKEDQRNYDDDQDDGGGGGGHTVSRHHRGRQDRSQDRSHQNLQQPENLHKVYTRRGKSRQNHYNGDDDDDDDDDGGSQVRHQKRGNNKSSSRSRRRKKSGYDNDDDENDDEDAYEGRKIRSITAIAWNKTKYTGTPLQLDDDSLSRHVRWLKRHDLSVVKLDSRERSGMEDVYPSMIAISWHGPDYENPLRQRTKECEEFFRFLSILRKNNWQIPILIGGDFNMDMKSFHMKDYKEFALVPYRPVSGTLAKDLKNTFMYTMDSLQVTEAGIKQHHPEIFPTPFITAKVRGRNLIRIWAVVRLHRAAMRWLSFARERRHTRQNLSENKKRWKKKLGHHDDRDRRDRRDRSRDSRDDYDRDYDRGGGRGSSATGYYSDDENVKRSYKEKIKANLKKNGKKDRKYALYWDERDDPEHEQEKQQITKEEYEHRRRKSFNQEGSKTVMDEFYEGTPTIVVDGGHRRKKFGDLKSVQDRKQEEKMSYY